MVQLKIGTSLYFLVPMLFFNSDGAAGSTVIAAEGGTAILQFTSEDAAFFGYKDAVGNTVYLAQVNPCKVYKPELYSFTCSSNDYTFTINQVTRDDERQYAVLDSNPAKTFDLKVYSTPITLTCDAPHLSSTTTGGNGRDVIVKCSTEKVYPKAECAFKLHGQTAELPTVTYNHTDVTYDGVVYYKSTCTLKYHVTSPKSYAFDVDMYLTLDGMRYGTKQNQTTQLILTLPTAVKSPTCPEGNANDIKDGYIRNGSTATCLCTRDHPGLPEGNVMWYNGNNAQVSSEGTSSRLTIPPGEATYVCKGTSDLGTQKDGVTYISKFAHGPTSTTATTIISHIDLCTTSSKSIIVNCKVPVSNVVPYPVFRVTIDGQSDADKQNGSIMASAYNFTKTLELTTEGQHNVLCEAENAVFPDIKASSMEQSIEVRKPPSLAPVFKIGEMVYTDNSNATVDGDVNSTLSIACEVRGGYPPVYNLSLKCGSDVSHYAGNKVSMDITVSEDTPGLDCACTALHVTGCYHNNNATVMLAFTFEKHRSSGSEGGNTAAIAGGVAGGILLLAGVIVVVVIAQRKGLPGKCRNRDQRLTYGHGSPSADDEITHVNDLYGTTTQQALNGSPYEDFKSDNGSNLYSNNAANPTKGESDVYENTKSQEANKKKGKELADGRYISEGGLLYTTVALAAPSSSSGNKGASMRPRIVEEGVQYTTVEFKK